MFVTVLGRAAQQILDLKAMTLLPAAGAPRAALRPAPLDESRHDPGVDALWSESWYFDAVDEWKLLGVYRLWLLPTVPNMPGGLAVGYVQHGDSLDEVHTGTSTHTVTSDGLVGAATLATGPHDLVLAVEPVAFGALRLVSPDGRVTHSPRAMATVRAGDGRTGTGWIEWNLNQ